MPRYRNVENNHLEIVLRKPIRPLALWPESQTHQGGEETDVVEGEVLWLGIGNALCSQLCWTSCGTLDKSFQLSGPQAPFSNDAARPRSLVFRSVLSRLRGPFRDGVRLWWGTGTILTSINNKSTFSHFYILTSYIICLGQSLISCTQVTSPLWVSASVKWVWSFILSIYLHRVVAKIKSAKCYIWY